MQVPQRSRIYSRLQHGTSGKHMFFEFLSLPCKSPHEEPCDPHSWNFCSVWQFKVNGDESGCIFYHLFPKKKRSLWWWMMVMMSTTKCSTVLLRVVHGLLKAFRTCDTIATHSEHTLLFFQFLSSFHCAVKACMFYRGRAQLQFSMPNIIQQWFLWQG